MSGVADKDKMIYLYCLTQSHEGTPPLQLTAKGVGDRGDEVYAISFLDLAFVVSDSAEDDYESSRKNTMAHQLVCEEVLKQGFTVLPVRFATVAEPTNKRSAGKRIGQLFRRRYGEFETLLRDMEDKVELGLKVFWQKEHLFHDIVAENADIRRMRDGLAAAGGLDGHYGRLELGTRVEEAIEVKRDADAQKLARALSPLAERYESNKILIDTMVLNAAFLVRKPGVGIFDGKVNELDGNLGEKMRFKYVGETPPFNFVQIVIHWEEIEDED